MRHLCFIYEHVRRAGLGLLDIPKCNLCDERFNLMPPFWVRHDGRVFSNLRARDPAFRLIKIIDVFYFVLFVIFHQNSNNVWYTSIITVLNVDI